MAYQYFMGGASMVARYDESKQKVEAYNRKQKKFVPSSMTIMEVEMEMHPVDEKKAMSGAKEQS